MPDDFQNFLDTQADQANSEVANRPACSPDIPESDNSALVEPLPSNIPPNPGECA